MIITLGPHGIFGSYFAYLFIVILYMVCKIVAIILASRGLLVKMLITLEPGVIFKK